MPQMANTAVLHGWNHEDDATAKTEIWAAIGDLAGIDIFGSQVLLGVYVRPAKTRGGILTTRGTQREDVWQGPVGMVLKIAPGAFAEGETPSFAVGDWVFGRVQDAHSLSYKGPGGKISAERRESGWLDEGWPCRLVYVSDIYGRVLRPEVVV